MADDDQVDEATAVGGHTDHPRRTSQAAAIVLGARLGVAAAVLGFGANVLHPRTYREQVADSFHVIADSNAWGPIHVAGFLSILLLLGGLFALDRFLVDAAGQEWARLALIVGIASVALGGALAALDGFALKTLADRWAELGRPRAGPVVEALIATEEIEDGFFSVFLATVVGLMPLVFGVAIVRSGRFARWVGPAAIVAGVTGVVAAAVHFTVGMNAVTVNFLFPAAVSLEAVAFFVMNATMLRASR